MESDPPGTSERRSARRRLLLRLGALLAALAIAVAIGLAISHLGLHQVFHAIGEAHLGWLALAFALMMLAFLARAVSWHEVLSAALPDVKIPWPGVIRAAMIGVMGSAVFPGRLGEPARAVVLARHLPGATASRVPLVAGTMLSQTLMNLLALAILAGITFSNVSIFHGHETGVLAGAVVALVLFAIVVAGPRLLRIGQRSSRRRVASAAAWVAGLLALARNGLTVFTRPRHAIPAVAAQLAAWALQTFACYAVLLALSLQGKAGIVGAAAILLAVNVTAVLPPTPSNVGVFQAACLVVLAAFGVGAGPALAYGFLLQAVELVTAVAMGTPALIGEGMSWRDVRRAAEEERRAERAARSPAAQALPIVIVEPPGPPRRSQR